MERLGHSTWQGQHLTPSPGTPGEGRGGGRQQGSLLQTPSLTLPRSTGGGDRSAV